MISASRRSSGSCWTPLEDPLEVVAVLDQRLGRVRRRDRARVVDRRLRLARAVAVVVRRQVVGDPDQPRPQRPPVRLALRALEVPVGLQERLLGEVLGVVVVADPVVRVRVDVAQMRPVELRRRPRRACALSASDPSAAMRHGGYPLTRPGRARDAAPAAALERSAMRSSCSDAERGPVDDAPRAPASSGRVDASAAADAARARQRDLELRRRRAVERLERRWRRGRRRRRGRRTCRARRPRSRA